ncbi:MAG: class C beta-lactamase-related serine hydrolase [Spirochaetia bacterium]|nr:class C beta-lactamase-related serine hydrolase [Spirochaetia bacterium]
MNESALKLIEQDFRKMVQNDLKVKNAYLLIHSETSNIHLNLAEGQTGKVPAHPEQPIYMASVGKIFTAAIIGMLAEQGALSFDDRLSRHLDAELLDALHVYKGKDYTDEITIRHLLKQTSGLFDNFWPLLQKMLDDPAFQISPREAVLWGKTNLKSTAPPGKKVKYTDTNYHLLGLIAESITGKPFHELLHELIFLPLGMEHSYMLHYSEPNKPNNHPVALFSMNQTTVNDCASYGKLDYAGGGVVAPLEDFLKFMQALTAEKLLSSGTLAVMIQDSDMLYPGIDYGYGIWKLKAIPLLLPKSYYCWGCVGATGAFLFYHPALDTYLIGTFNDVSYRTKAVKFMMQCIKRLLKCQET